MTKRTRPHLTLDVITLATHQVSRTDVSVVVDVQSAC